MPQFEYAVVSSVTNNINIQGYVYWPNGSYTADHRPFVLVLNWMASMGWEVVTSTSSGSVLYWTLKRAVATHPALG